MPEFWNHPRASVLIPAARAYIRYAPASARKERFWREVVDPYLAWRDHRFTARTVAGRIAGSTRDILQQYLYYFGAWEPQVSSFIRDRLKPGDSFIDVGANIGYFSLLASRLVGRGGPVVSVEASPSIHHDLAENIRRNGAAIRAVNRAASDKAGVLKLDVAVRVAKPETRR